MNTHPQDNEVRIDAAPSSGENKCLICGGLVGQVTDDVDGHIILVNKCLICGRIPGKNTSRVEASINYQERLREVLYRTPFPSFGKADSDETEARPEKARINVIPQGTPFFAEPSGHRIRRRRKALGLSIAELAVLAGKTKNSMGVLESTAVSNNQTVRSIEQVLDRLEKELKNKTVIGGTKR